MTAVLSEIERIRRNEQAQAWDAAEKEMEQRLYKKFKPEVMKAINQDIATHFSGPDPDAQLRSDFTKWCADHSVRSCPARPGTVGTFLLEHCRTHDQMLEALAVIGRMHDRHSNLNSPCGTPAVRLVLESAMDDKPPRSWPNADKERWALLPADIRFAISRRERHREAELSRMRNENANLPEN